jgi:hypothetical protein
MSIPRLVLIASALAVAAVPVAFAGSAQVVQDPRGDAHGPANQDLVRATVLRVGGRQVHTLRTAGAFALPSAPCLYILHARHTIFVCGQSPGGQFAGFGPGNNGPHATVSRPAPNEIRYSFSASKLGLKRSYRWYATAAIHTADKLPNRGTVTTKLP